MDGLVTDVAHQQPGDDRPVGLVGHHPLLAALDREALQPPVVGVVEVEGIAAVDRTTVDHRVARATHRDRSLRRRRPVGDEVSAVLAVRERDEVPRLGCRERGGQLLGR